MSARPPTRLKHEVWEQGTSRGIRIGDWEIETCKRPILNASEIDEASGRLDIPLPEITFGNNYVSLTRRSKGKQREAAASDEHDAQEGQTGSDVLAFKSIDSLEQVDKTGEDAIKVAYADKWAKSRNLESSGSAEQVGAVNGDSTGDNIASTVIETVKNYDWTYSTSYAGTSSGGMSFQQAPPAHPGIPLSKLGRQDEPILFYDEVTLFEDELHDNGVANVNIKIRVMPSCLFLLSRFFLRVDNVLFRIFDVRLYHDFATSEVIRETKGKEAPYTAVKNRLPRERADDLTPLTDANWVANLLGMLEQTPPQSAGPPSPTSSRTSRPNQNVLPSSMTGSPAAVAPWSEQPRRQVAAGVSVPLRAPFGQTPASAHATTRPAPSEDALKASTSDLESRAVAGKRRWHGLGTKLEVATLSPSTSSCS